MGKSGLGVLLFLISPIFLAVHIVQEVHTNYIYDKTIQSYWDLGVKASTLEQKAAYINDFVEALDAAQLHGNDAVVFPTPNNSAEQNMVALKSLQSRMREIQHMDVTSFQYQQAMLQITAQEQGEAQSMLDTLKGVWYKSNHFFLWRWVDALRYILEILLGAIGLGLIVGTRKIRRRPALS
jgi:hypothetical protein